jgi:hypothetical protein
VGRPYIAWAAFKVYFGVVMQIYHFKSDHIYDSLPLY